MSYGELNLGQVWSGTDKQTGQFLKGHVPANKGKRWSDYMSKRAQKRSAKGWKNLDLHRNKNGRSDVAGRCRKQVVAVMDDGSWVLFPHIGSAAELVGGRRENVGRCCRSNQSRKQLKKPYGHPTDKVNIDHKYKGVRFYFVDDDTWTSKIKKT